MKAGLQDLKLELWFRMREAGNIKWTTASNSEVSIKDMTLQHLINTINMLVRHDYNEDGASVGDGPDIDSAAFIL